MIRKIEIAFNVTVDLSEEDYQKIMDNVTKSHDSGFGLELWEIEALLNPNKFIGRDNRKTYYPQTVELPEMSRDNEQGVILSTTKIEFIS